MAFAQLNNQPVVADCHLDQYICTETDISKFYALEIFENTASFSGQTKDFKLAFMSSLQQVCWCQDKVTSRVQSLVIS